MHKQTPILVTGGTGLIGSYILRYLLALGYTNVHASLLEDDTTTLVPDPEAAINWINCDLTDRHGVYALVADRTHIIHAASHISYASRDHAVLYEQNVEATRTLVNAALDQGAEKFVFISSVDALMRKPGMTLIDESVGWEESNLTSNYARSRFLAEMEVWRGHHEGLSTMILNPSAVLGGGFWKHRDLRLMSTLHRGLRFFPAGSTGVVDVRDVARAALISLLDPTLIGKRAIINGANLSYSELYTKIAKAIEAKKPTWLLSGMLGSLALIIVTIKRGLGIRGGFSPEVLRLMYENFQYSNEQSRQYLNLTYTALEQTIADLGRVFKKSKEANLDYGLCDLIGLKELFDRTQM